MIRTAPTYNPWHDLRDNWPEVRVVFEPMTGRLLGELRYPVIALRTGTSAAQRRCTLAHEIVHLERRLPCGPGLDRREERWVSAEAARRLVTVPDLRAALRDLGAGARPASVAAHLRIDRDTLRLRLQLLTPGEQRLLLRCAEDEWGAA